MMTPFPPAMIPIRTSRPGSAGGGHPMLRKVLVCAALLVAGACGGDAPVAPAVSGGSGTPPTEGQQQTCLTLPLPINGTTVSKDGIPALTNPEFLPLDAPEIAALSGDTRVVGFMVGGEALAVPLYILWWHEIVNVDRGSERVAMSYCPLTGSAIAFDRQPIGGLTLGVSGVLYDNNLVMYDRSNSESLWAQMAGLAICGQARGRTLPSVRSLDTTLAEWTALHPSTQVASRNTGHDRNYDANPYEDYWRLDAPPLFETELLDGRREPKELVLAVPSGALGGIAIPFGELDATARVALNLEVSEAYVVAFWDGPSRSAVAHYSFAEWPSGFSGATAPLTFTAEAGGYRDDQTGTLWDLWGRAIAGPGVGAELVRHPRSYVAFWFAWSTLHPETEIFTTS